MNFKKDVKDASPKERVISVILGIVIGAIIGMCFNYMCPSVCHGKTLKCEVIQVHNPILPEGDKGTITIECESAAYDVLQDGMKIKVKPAKKKAIEGC